MDVLLNRKEKHSQPNVVELNEWLTDVALVRNQIIAKRSHEPRGTTKTRKLNHIHKKKPERMLQKTRVKTSTTKAQIIASVAQNGYTNSGAVQTSK